MENRDSEYYSSQRIQPAAMRPENVGSLPGDPVGRTAVHHAVKSHMGNFALMWIGAVRSSIRIDDRPEKYLTGDAVTFYEVIGGGDVFTYTKRSITGRIWFIQTPESVAGLRPGYVQLHFLETGRSMKAREEAAR